MCLDTGTHNPFGLSSLPEEFGPWPNIKGAHEDEKNSFPSTAQYAPSPPSKNQPPAQSKFPLRQPQISSLEAGQHSNEDAWGVTGLSGLQHWNMVPSQVYAASYSSTRHCLASSLILQVKPKPALEPSILRHERQTPKPELETRSPTVDSNKLEHG